MSKRSRKSRSPMNAGVNTREDQLRTLNQTSSPPDTMSLPTLEKPIFTSAKVTGLRGVLLGEKRPRAAVWIFIKKRSRAGNTVIDHQAAKLVFALPGSVIQLGGVGSSIGDVDALGENQEPFHTLTGRCPEKEARVYSVDSLKAFCSSSRTASALFGR